MWNNPLESQPSSTKAWPPPEEEPTYKHWPGLLQLSMQHLQPLRQLIVGTRHSLHQAVVTKIRNDGVTNTGVIGSRTRSVIIHIHRHTYLYHQCRHCIGRGGVVRLIARIGSPHIVPPGESRTVRLLLWPTFQGPNNRAPLLLVRQDTYNNT